MTTPSFIDKTGGKPDHFRFTDALGIQIKMPVGNLEKIRNGWKVDGISTSDIWNIKIVELVDVDGNVIFRADGGGTNVKTGEIFGLFLEEENDG